MKKLLTIFCSIFVLSIVGMDSKDPSPRVRKTSRRHQKMKQVQKKPQRLGHLASVLPYILFKTSKFTLNKEIFEHPEEQEYIDKLHEWALAQHQQIYKEGTPSTIKEEEYEGITNSLCYLDSVYKETAAIYVSSEFLEHLNHRIKAIEKKKDNLNKKHTWALKQMRRWFNNLYDYSEENTQEYLSSTFYCHECYIKQIDKGLDFFEKKLDIKPTKSSMDISWLPAYYVYDLIPSFEHPPHDDTQ